ncbi:MAG: DUF11 domain-containing protein, partial [Anaerolineales bacterium]|nr:DUF11 domain-containing protein [Anaerolineales bacterium]
LLFDDVPAELLVDLATLAFSDTPANCAVGVDTSSSAGNVIEASVDELPLGCSLEITFDALVQFPGVLLGDTITNDVAISWTSQPGPNGDERDGSGGVNDYSADDSLVLTVEGVDLAITKDDGGINVDPGDDIDYTLSYVNNGNADATGVVITETVPDYTTFNAALSTVGWSCANGSPAGTVCTFPLGTIASGASATVNFVVTVITPLPAAITETLNTTRIDDDGSKGLDPTPSDNEDSDITPLQAVPDLEILKDNGVSIVAPGSIFTYTLTISNIGNQDATGVAVSDTLPPQVTFLSAIDSGVEAGGIVTWPLFDLASGDTVTRTVTVQVNDPFTPFATQITNQATVTDDGTNGPDPDLSNNTDDDTDQLVSLANLNITKQVTASNQAFTAHPEVAIGEMVSYEIILSIPPGDLPAMMVADTLTAGLAFVECVEVIASSGDLTTTLAGGFSSICSSAVFEEEPTGSVEPVDQGRRMVLDFGDVANTGAVNHTITIRYTAVVLNSLDNVSQTILANSALWEWQSGLLSVLSEDLIVVEPQLVLAMTADRDVVLPGQAVTFRLTLQHTSGSETDAFDVVLSNQLPASLVLIPGTLRHVSGQTPTLLTELGASVEITWDQFLNNGQDSVIEFQA